MPVVGVEKMMDTNQDSKTELPTVESKARSVARYSKIQTRGMGRYKLGSKVKDPLKCTLHGVSTTVSSTCRAPDHQTWEGEIQIDFDR